MQRASKRFASFVSKQRFTTPFAQKYSTEAAPQAEQQVSFDVYSKNFHERIRKVLNFNSEGKVTEAVEAYEDLKKIICTNWIY